MRWACCCLETCCCRSTLLLPCVPHTLCPPPPPPLLLLPPPLHPPTPLPSPPPPPPRPQVYDPRDDSLRATTMEIISTLKELLHLHPLYNEQMRNFIQFGADFHDLSRLSDLATSLTSGDSAELQAALEQLSVPDRCAVCVCGVCGVWCEPSGGRGRGMWCGDVGWESRERRSGGGCYGERSRRSLLSSALHCLPCCRAHQALVLLKKEVELCRLQVRAACVACL